MLKNVTFSTDESVLQQARRRAVAEHTTLNELFRRWLEQYVAQPAAADTYALFMARMQHVQPGRSFNREEMNERD